MASADDWFSIRKKKALGWICKCKFTLTLQLLQWRCKLAWFGSCWLVCRGRRIPIEPFQNISKNLDMILQCITTFRRFGTNANAGLTNTKVDQCSLSIAICGAKLKPGKTVGRESLAIYRAQTTNKEWSY